MFASYIKEVLINVSVEGESFHYPFFKKFQQPSIKTATKQFKSPQLDDMNIKLLQILTEHARTPVKSIARSLKITEATVRARIKWLEKSGLIHQYTILLHPGHIGYSFNLMLIRLNTPCPELESYLKKVPEIFYLVKGAGFFDIKAEFYSETADRVHEIEEDMYQKFIGKVAHINILHVKKEHGVRYFVNA